MLRVGQCRREVTVEKICHAYVETNTERGGGPGTGEWPARTLQPQAGVWAPPRAALGGREGREGAEHSEGGREERARGGGYDNVKVVVVVM